MDVECRFGEGMKDLKVTEHKTAVNGLHAVNARITCYCFVNK